MQMWYFAQAQNKGEFGDEGERKKILTAGGDVKRTNENTIH